MQSEEAKLVAFFRSPEGEALGQQGDHDNLSPAETAIRAMRRLQSRAPVPQTYTLPKSPDNVLSARALEAAEVQNDRERQLRETALHYAHVAAALYREGLGAAPLREEATPEVSEAQCRVLCKLIAQTTETVVSVSTARTMILAVWAARSEAGPNDR